jgi:hypothetical protein
MSQILLALFGFMVCVFYLVVLIQWVRDTKRAKNIASMAEKRATRERQRAHAAVIGIRKHAGSGQRVAAQASKMSAAAERHFQASAAGWSIVDGDVYRTIARSLTGDNQARAGSRFGPTHNGW